MSIQTKNDITDTNEFQHIVSSAIETVLKTECEKVFDLYKKQMNDELDRLRPELVAGTVISLMKKIDMQTMNDRLIFTIRTP